MRFNHILFKFITLISLGFLLSQSQSTTCIMTNCNTCLVTNPNICTKCSQYYYLLNGSCYNPCPNGYYANSASDTCEPCDPTCNTCNDQTKYNCTSCIPNSSLSNQGACIGVCNAVGTYLDTLSGKCLKCHESCYICNGPAYNQCLACMNGLYFYQGICGISCPIGFYSDDGYDSCLPCSITCLECSIQATKCISCLSGTFLENNKCVGSCSSTKVYQDTTLNKCINCDSTCNTCNGAGNTSCTSCTNSLYLYQNQCISNCPKGTYLSGNKCLSCYPTCETCTGSQNNTCLTCIYGKYLNLNNQCVNDNECNMNFYANSTLKKCQNCLDPNCLKCLGGGPNDCLQCGNAQNNNQYKLFNGTCALSCLDIGYFYDSESNSCIPCQAPCYKCLTSPEQCIACQDPYYYFNSTCVLTCPTYTTLEKMTNECQLTICPQFCAQCVSNNTCVLCEINTYHYDNQCYLTCPSGTYPLETTQTCQPCHYSCENCLGPNFNDCTSCYDQFELSLIDITKGRCIRECLNQSYFYQYESDSCIPCDLSCYTCLSFNTCTSCNPGFIPDLQNLNQISTINWIGGCIPQPQLNTIQLNYEDFLDKNKKIGFSPIKDHIATYFTMLYLIFFLSIYMICNYLHYIEYGLEWEKKKIVRELLKQLHEKLKYKKKIQKKQNLPDNVQPMPDETSDTYIPFKRSKRGDGTKKKGNIAYKMISYMLNDIRDHHYLLNIFIYQNALSPSYIRAILYFLKLMIMLLICEIMYSIEDVFSQFTPISKQILIILLSILSGIITLYTLAYILRIKNNKAISFIKCSIMYWKEKVSKFQRKQHIKYYYVIKVAIVIAILTTYINLIIEQVIGSKKYSVCLSIFGYAFLADELIIPLFMSILVGIAHCLNLISIERLLVISRRYRSLYPII